MAERYIRESNQIYRIVGSAAYDIRVPERVRVTLPEDQVVPQPVRREQPRYRVSPFAIFGIAVTAFLAVLIIFCQVRLYEVNSGIASLQEQLEMLEENHVRLESSYHTQLDLLDLRTYAETMGMHRPAESQIVELDLGGADHAVITPAKERNLFAAAFGAIRNSFLEFLEYIT